MQRLALTLVCLGLGGCASPPTNPEPVVPDAAVNPQPESDPGAAEAAESGEGAQATSEADGEGEPESGAQAPADGGETAGTGGGDTGSNGGETTPPADPEQGADTTKSASSQVKTEPSLPAPLYKKVDSSCGQDPGVGTQVKAMALPTTSGKTIDIKSYRRRVVLLNFWGTWCKPCLKELPEFSRLYRRYRKYGLTLIAVATDEEPEKVDEFIKQRKIAGKILIKGQQLADDYRSPNFPFSYVVAPGGKITGSYRRYRPECMGKLEQDIREELLKLQK